jgi:hypothetical protein
MELLVVSIHVLMDLETQGHNAQLLGMDRRSGAIAIATPCTLLTAETQWYGLLKFANAPAKYSDSDFLGSAEVREKYTLDFPQ